ncbi:membrane protein [Pilimelia terevasa]|uniref:Membrane protein n=1 Tax=Pilimelia terevasa TaxID=53372 RepID=A0A8J3BPN5_9ACTN|nr:metal-dependent hydrolase [Pilimelia terevasa]GGK24331.1 membrane protein [Pilimelia terevasa]
MMGPSHALSGAAVWLVGSWTADHVYGYAQTPAALAVGTAVCAGGALLPDLDMSGKVTANRGGATVARTFGIFTLLLAEIVEKLSLFVYHATKLRRDPSRRNGHRTFTHTLPFVVGVGWGTTWLCTRYGKWAVLGVLFVMIGLALRGLADRWADRVGWLGVTLAAAGAALAAYVTLPGARAYPELGFAVGVGCLVHLLGDLITSAGIPILWPLPLAGRTWRMIGLPRSVAVRAGGPGEVALRGLFVLAALLAGTALAAPAAVDRVLVVLS